MNQPHTLRLSTWARLLMLSLLLGLGVLASLGLASGIVHAATTLTVTNCSNESQLQADVTQANSDNAGDIITFSCSGDIRLTRTLYITGTMTIDGSGQSVTLDGSNSVEVLAVNGAVNPAVSFTLNALTVAHGSDPSEGGGLSNNIGTVSISNSTFANNSAGNSQFYSGSGGGLYSNGGTVNISNSTFVNNSTVYSQFTPSHTGSGGGLYSNGGTVSIRNSTFANNSAHDGGGFEGGTLNIGGSIVANNTGGNCASLLDLSSQGYNLSSDSSCGFGGTGDLQNTNPKLASALASNGGPTQTIALLSGSPAIDRIPAASCPATDQRGFTRPDNRETTCDIGAYESSDDNLGLTNMPSNVTVNATSPQGASVTYTPPMATDESGDNPGPSVNCNPASGSLFPIGTTKVTCTASDSDDINGPVSQSFTVTVNDTDLDLANLPATITTDATSPQGAAVTYTLPTVVDEESPLPAVRCSPASGSTFAIGTTTVTCTVNDSDDMPASVSQSFQVVVKGASAQLSDLINLVSSFQLSQGIQRSFDSQLQAVQADLQAGNTVQACGDSTAFINHARAQSGKALTVSQANQLIAAAKQVQAVLGC